jgi:hypothetical protein
MRSYLTLLDRRMLVLLLETANQEVASMSQKLCSTIQYLIRPFQPIREEVSQDSNSTTLLTTLSSEPAAARWPLLLP